MNYQIIGLCPRSDISLGAWGFGIKLFPEFKIAVKQSEITEDNAWRAIERRGRLWLDGCGYNAMSDYGEEPEPLYMPNQAIRVSWGEWGPEHITVPGNACGLDIDDGIMAPKDGKILNPHNVDAMRQAMLLLIVFAWFAETIHCLAEKN